MNEKLSISDAEIRGLMNFQGLVSQAGAITYWTSIFSSFKAITGSIVAVSVSVTALLIWTGQDESVRPPDHSTPAANTIPQAPIDNPPAVDSTISLKRVPDQEPSTMEVKPKNHAAASREKEDEEKKTPAAPSTAVYLSAEPIQGFPHLYEYFHTELKYPDEGVKDSIKAFVTVTFVITKLGQIDKITVYDSPSPAFDAEAIRLIKNMPPWKPATIDGRPVISKFSLPLTFEFKQVNKLN